MRRLAAALTLVALATTPAQAQSADPAASLRSLLNRKAETARPFTAKLRVIDRHTDRPFDYIVERGAPARHADLSLSVIACVPGHGGIPSNDAALIEVTGISGTRLFSGWMMTDFPGTTTFDDPRFSLIFRGCDLK